MLLKPETPTLKPSVGVFFLPMHREAHAQGGAHARGGGRLLVVRQGPHEPLCFFFRPNQLHPLPEPAEDLMGYQLGRGESPTDRSLGLHPNGHTSGEQEDSIRPASLIVREKLHALPTKGFSAPTQMRFYLALKNIFTRHGVTAFRVFVVIKGNTSNHWGRRVCGFCFQSRLDSA